MKKSHAVAGNLTIVLPCFNPPEGWHETVIESIAKLEHLMQNISLALIIVNDGSKRNMSKEANIIREHISDFKWIELDENRGKGYALRAGFQKVETEYVMFTDIDFPFTEESMKAIYNTLKNTDCDIAPGYRSEQYYAHVPLFRKWLSKIFKWFIMKLIRIPIADTQCGLKGFNKKGQDIFLRTTIDRYLFDLEVFVLANHTIGTNVVPVQVMLRENIVFSKMGWKILLTESFNFLKILWKKK